MKDIKLDLSGAPGGAEEVLVVLQGVHQSIPAEPPILQDSAKMLPPPMDSDGKTQVSVKPQTEADKVVQRYQDLGKQQEHVYGAYGSGIPNFNLKPPGAPGAPNAGAENATAEAKPDAPGEGASADSKTVPAVRTPPKPSASAVPSLLGARPGKTPSLTVAPLVPTLKPAAPEMKPKVNSPVLPLGAPRKKTTSTSPPPAPQ